MNILFISTNYPYPPDSGHNLRTYNVLRILSKQHKIFYLAFTKKKEDLNNNDPIKEMCKSVDIFFIPDDFSKIRMFFSLFINLFSPYPYIANKYYRTDMRDRIKSIIHNNDISLVHFDLLHLSRYIHDVGSTIKTLTEHNVESIRVLRLLKNIKNPFFKLYMYIQYKKLYYFEKKICPKFDMCIAVSRDDLDTLKKMAPKTKLIEIPNGVDTEYFKPEEPVTQTPNSLLWVGAMSDPYNREAVDYFCGEIFLRIHEKNNDIKFVVIGHEPSNALIELSKKYHNVKILSYVEDIRPYMHSSVVFVAPMKSGGGTKLKVLNALAMGKPVITTTIGAEGIDVHDGENILIADDPVMFAEKTVNLLKNPEQVATIGKKARKLILEKYDWDIIGNNQNSLYEILTNKTILHFKK